VLGTSNSQSSDNNVRMMVHERFCGGDGKVKSDSSLQTEGQQEVVVQIFLERGTDSGEHQADK